MRGKHLKAAGMFGAVVVVVLNIPNFIPVVVDKGIGFNSEIAAYGLLFWGAWFALFRHFRWGLLAAIPITSWWVASVYLRWVYATPITPEFLGMLLDSNFSELANFVATFGYGAFIATFLVPIICLFFVALVWKQNLVWGHRSRSWVIGLVVFLVGALGSIFYVEKNNDNVIVGESADPFEGLRDSYWLERWGKIYPLDLPLAGYRSMRDQKRVAELRKQLANHDMQACAAGEMPDVVVLVIGESSRRDRWGIFGYERQTTPRLAEVKNIVTLNNMVSISAATRSAVPSLVSRRPYYGPSGAAKDAEPSIVKAFSAVGYRTFWISNQTASGFYDAPIAFYAQEADEVIYSNPTAYTARGSLDGQLLPIFNDVLSAGEDRKFVILHTMGSHFNYAYRYPAEYEIYKPALSAEACIFKRNEIDKNSLNNSYDNSIVYTDFILASLIESLRKHGGSSVLVYASDHGEDLWDPDCLESENQRKSYRAFEIPAFFWFSDVAMTDLAVSEQQLRLNADRATVGSVMPQTILDVAGIKVAGPPADSYMQASEPEHPRRVYAHTGWVDFDMAKLKNACHITP